jgi:hypothetical protein
LISCTKSAQTSGESTANTEPRIIFSPVIISSFPINENALGTYIEGDYVYVLTLKSFQIIDVSNKENPSAIGNLSAGDEEFYPWAGLIIKNNFAYITYKIYDKSGEVKSSGLKIIDITDKKNPVYVGDYKASEFITDISLEDNYLYTSYEISEKTGDNSYSITESGLKIIDVTDKKTPGEVGSYVSPVSAYSNIFVEGDYAYISMPLYLQIIDVTDKKNPKDIKDINTDKFAASTIRLASVYVNGNYLYMTNGNSMQIFDVTNKKRPALIGSSVLSGEAESIYTSIYCENNYVYITNHIGIGNNIKESDLQIIDVSDNKNPKIVSSCKVPGEAVSVIVQNGYAYVASVFDGLYIIKLSK